MKKTKKLLMLLTLVLSLAMPANMPVLGALSTTETVSAARLNYRQITLVKGRSQRLAMVGTAKKAKWRGWGTSRKTETSSSLMSGSPASDMGISFKAFWSCPLLIRI